MDFWTFVFLVVLCGCCVAIFETWSKNRVKMREAHGRVNPDSDKRIAGLTERVKVLEEIVTDSRYDLKREIEELEERSSSSR